ncbi:MAG: zf-HC2 domain-containing protein [Deltaproteobacteria bacterium]|nr:zf-HC2 domain-containing protein [Deltaproteobacteria bacterium]
MTCPKHEDIVKYVAGLLDEEYAAKLEGHLAECRQCNQVYQELSNITGRLAPDPGEFNDQEFAGDIMTLIRLKRPKIERPGFPRKFFPKKWLAPFAAACAAAALLLVIWPNNRLDESTGFTARGGMTPGKDRWVSLEVFRPSPGGGYHPVTDRIMPHDALAFAYVKQRAGTFLSFLMVFAVDETGRVYWYYPEYSREDENPHSIYIGSGSGRASLPDEIRHDFKKGLLRIFAVFSKGPLYVRHIESVVSMDLKKAGSLENLERLALKDTGQQSILVTVSR